MALLRDLLEVRRPSERDFEGRCLEGAHGRVFGGQVLAQSMYAAAQYAASPSGRSTGDENGRALSSVHTHFLRPGDPAHPVRYHVTPLKLGRTLSVVRIDAVQADREILTSTVSFHDTEDSPDIQVEAPRVPPPDELERSEYVPAGTNGAVRAVFDIRYTDPAPTLDLPAEPRQAVWFRAENTLPAYAVVHACAIAYASDLTLTRTAHMPLKAYAAHRIGASLDHSMWFHRPGRADEWMLFAQRSTTFAGSRALSHAHIFDTAGRLIATAVQEALIRMRE